MSVQSEIVSKASDISLEKAEVVKQKKFCELWPQAKLALDLLKETIKNPIVKVIVGTVEAAGDAVVGSICK